jgi:tRNA pseudouridine55 synthase
MHGILNLNKPAGRTSFAMVSLVRRLTGVRRVGHAGTLDPIADGVLPICVGSATRVVEYIVDGRKAYRAAIHLGVATNTYDTEGAVVATADPSAVTEEAIKAALQASTGCIDQVPPMHSAIKHAGRPLYAYARAGRSIDRQSRRVMVYRAQVRAYSPPIVEVDYEVGRGAYIRTLAHELGERLGCYGHIARLTRLQSGPFHIEDAVDIEQLERYAAEGRLHQCLYPPDRPLEGFDAALLGAGHSVDVLHGRPVNLELLQPGSTGGSQPAQCRAYSATGDFLALLRRQSDGAWRPSKVFPQQ